MQHGAIPSLFLNLAVLLGPVLAAQSGPMPPPPLVLFVREEVKPGHGAAHAVTEAAWTRALVKGKAKEHYLGMTAMTGPSEAWFLIGYNSYADWEVKQGQGMAFEEGVKTALAAYSKSQYPASFAFFEVVAGMGSPSFVALRPMKSLAEMDAMDAADTAFREALGEEGRKNMQKVFAETVNAVENQLFMFSPKLSFVGPQTMASDPAFWTPKPPAEGKK